MRIFNVWLCEWFSLTECMMGRRQWEITHHESDVCREKCVCLSSKRYIRKCWGISKVPAVSQLHRTKLLIQNCNFRNYISKNTSSTHYVTEGGEKWDSIFILLVLSFNYTFDHNCETNLSDFHRWPISERVVKPIGVHVFNMFSDVGYRDWNAYWGDGERTTFTSKQRGYCWEPPLWAPGTWEISDNRYLWKQVNFSQLQKTEIGAITQTMCQASHTMCFWKQKVSSFCINLKVYLKIQLRRVRGYVISSSFFSTCRPPELSFSDDKGPWYNNNRKNETVCLYSICFHSALSFIFIIYYSTLYLFIIWTLNFSNATDSKLYKV